MNWATGIALALIFGIVGLMLIFAYGAANQGSPSLSISSCNAPVDGATATWDADNFCIEWVAP
jgi:hypothetical protein